MFKSIQWKLVIIFVVLVAVVVLVVGAFLQGHFTASYHDDFLQQMNRAFSEEFLDQLALATGSDSPETDILLILCNHSGEFGLSPNRDCFLLRQSTGDVLDSLKDSTPPSLGYTNNIVVAMTGRRGDKIEHGANYIDYAVPIGSEYIIYLRDDKTDLAQMWRMVFIAAGEALAFGILASIILGFVLSRTITQPITNLTQRAERFAQGDFDSRIDVKTNDEIGKLSRTFNYMALVVKKAVSDIAQEQKKLETILRYMADGVMAFDNNGYIILTNPAAVEILSINEDEDYTFDEFFQKLGLDVCIAEFAYLDQHNSIEKELQIEQKHYIVHFAQFKTDRNNPGGVVVVLQDRTETQKMDAMRREFVANVSHELRTPLTTTKGYAETLLDGLEEERVQERHFLSVICREVDRMTRIVKDLLTLSTLDMASMAANKKYFSLDDLLREVVERLSFDAEVHEQKLTYEAATTLPQIYADRDRIEQVIVNIISNAIKYTPEKTGAIMVHAGYLYNELYIKVKDNGIGIPQKDLSRIFERFYRVDKARARDKGGTGLGLAIAREIILLHGGDITITSQISKGTEVIIKLPVVNEGD